MNVKTAFVTGATGLLGNNLVRELRTRGIRVKALARSTEKAKRQFYDLDGVEIVVGDLTNVEGFSGALQGVDVLFHTAAFFRDGYKGGSHWEELKRINIEGTRALVRAAYDAGIRRMVHTSSIAVLNGTAGSTIDETSERREEDADHYYRSKIFADREIKTFLAEHPDFHACMVLPGWMWGPGDIGPTSAGQVALDTVQGRLPGLVPGSFSFVDARDVAKAQIAAADKGRRGERYLAAGRHMMMKELVPLIGKIAGVPTPTRTIPLPLLYGLASLQEIYRHVSGKPILLSLATVKLMAQEADRTRFNHQKSESELGVTFRPTAETVRDTIEWYRANGWLDAKAEAA